MSEPSDSPQPAARSWREAVRGNVLAMGLVSLLTDAGSEMVNPLLPIFITGLVPVGWAAVYVGLMEGVAETTASLLKIFSGRISDRLGKRKALVVLGYGLSSLCRPLTGLAGAGWHVLGLKFADRIGKGIRTSPRDALIGDSVGPRHRGLAFSFHRIMDHIGAIIGPVVAVAILYAMLGSVLWRGHGEQATGDEMHAMRWLFAVSLIPGILAMAALVLKVRETAPRAAPSSPGADSRRAGLPGRFYAFVAIATLFALGNSSDYFLLYYARASFGFSILEVMALWMVLHFSKVVFSIPGGVVSDRIGRRPVIVAGWLVYAAVYLGLSRADTAWHLWALVAAYGFYYGMTEGVEKALVADFVPSRFRGTAYGIYHGAVGIAALPASLVFGLLWKYCEQMQPGLGPMVAFSVGAALAGLAAVLLTILLGTARGTRHAADATSTV
ncbi:MAG: MFS transporter [Phycisphaerae bacterium]|nr:MFS transporter [Phycisphaerae bacterium]